jgi:hypothetical protein
MWSFGLDSSDPRYGPVAGFCKHDNEPVGYLKDDELFD